MRHIRILTVVSVSCFIGCTSSTNPSEAKVDSSIINNHNSSYKNRSSSDSTLFVPCNDQKDKVVKFTTLFKQKRVDSNLIVSMEGIKCCHVDFLFSHLAHPTVYDVRNWDFDYEQLIKFKDDKRTCPKVLTPNDRKQDNTRVMSCKGNAQHESTLSTETLKFLNSKILGYYPCDAEYTYMQIDSIHSLHVKK